MVVTAASVYSADVSDPAIIHLPEMSLNVSSLYMSLSQF